MIGVEDPTAVGLGVAIAAVITALTGLIGACTKAYLTIKGQLSEVHDLVNSNHDDFMAQFNRVQNERDILQIDKQIQTEKDK